MGRESVPSSSLLGEPGGDHGSQTAQGQRGAGGGFRCGPLRSYNRRGPTVPVLDVAAKSRMCSLRRSGEPWIRSLNSKYPRVPMARPNEVENGIHYQDAPAAQEHAAYYIRRVVPPEPNHPNPDTHASRDGHGRGVPSSPGRRRQDQGHGHRRDRHLGSGGIGEVARNQLPINDRLGYQVADQDGDYRSRNRCRSPSAAFQDGGHGHDCDEPAEEHRR